MDIFRFPLVRITAWFVPGIVVAYYFPMRPVVALVYFFVTFGILLAAYVMAGKNFRQKPYFACAVYFVSFCSGIAALSVHDCYSNPGNYIRQVDRNEVHVLRLVLREKLKNTARRQRYIAIVKCIDDKNSSGKILLNFHSDAGRRVCIGSEMVVACSIVKNGRPLNPGQFDYGKYLDNKSVPAQAFVNDKQFLLTGKTDKDIWFYSDRFRTKIISNLQKSGFRNAELQVLNALVLGQQQEISPDIVRDYQYAGAVHILSVSGLHVGFILLFLNFLLDPLPKNRAGRLARLVLILFFLWGFAIVAGLSASVVRSATMFSFLAFGMYLRRSTNIFHTLVVSILLILLFEPEFLFDVGFQLSYVALFFILWLQPLLSQIWLPKNRPLKYFWDILTVSFAAQIGAFPLSIYYFHQFPGLFFITNLAVIPFLSVIMVLGVLVMGMAAFGFVPHFTVFALERCIFILNKIIGWVASFEDFIIRDIPLDFYLLISLYLLIFTSVLWFKKPAFGRLSFALVSVIIFQSAILVAFRKTACEKELIVFNSGKNSLIAIRNGAHIDAYSSIPMENHLMKPYGIVHFCKPAIQKRLRNTLWFEGHKILIADSCGIIASGQDPDILVLTHSPKINLDRVLKTGAPKMVVADGSNFKSYTAVWKQTCAKQKIPFHDTREKGFFRLNK